MELGVAIKRSDLGVLYLAALNSFISFLHIQTLVIEVLFFSFIFFIDASCGLCYKVISNTVFICFIFRDLIDVGLLIP